MYKVYFNESFFEWLDLFVNSMKNYYYNFYTNTWLYNENIILQSYFEIYEKMKTDVLNEINSICENWLNWRKTTYSYEKIENCSFIFIHWNYKVFFTAIKNDVENKIIVNSVKIEI